MADSKFPNTPKYNQLIEKDEQIVKVPMENTEFGARPSALPKNVKNSNSIRHVS